jgi:hypothetical protein
MPSIDRRAVPAVALLVAGVALVGGAFVLFTGAGDPAYVHSVEPVAESEVPEEADVLEYSDLSPAGQRAFRNAREAPDGEYVVRDEAEKPREFVYSDHVEVNRGIHFVRYRGEYYRLDTGTGGGLGFLARWIRLALGGIGTLLALVGGVSLARGDERTPLAVWAGIGSVAVLALLLWAFPGVIAAGYVQLVPAALLAFAVGTVLVYRYAGRRIG